MMATSSPSRPNAAAKATFVRQSTPTRMTKQEQQRRSGLSRSPAKSQGGQVAGSPSKIAGGGNLLSPLKGSRSSSPGSSLTHSKLGKNAKGTPKKPSPNRPSAASVGAKKGKGGMLVF